jgi:site-specific DNA-adenine methylase
MPLANVDKAPFPWFGGKSKAAPLVWSLLGDVPHYVEPFAGSLAVLIGRPHPANRPYFSETVNDLDGFVVNAWRSIQHHPEETAAAASWPVSEADKTAREIAVIKWRTDETLDLLAGDPDWCDPKMAGWWLWGVACQIGAIGGPWTSDPVTGRIYKQPRDTATREEGVSRGRPHINDNGVGVNRLQLREEGVSRKRPHLSNNGQGVNRPQLREAGVSRNRPHLANNGRGVNHAGTREAGVMFSDAAHDRGYHPQTMPELVRWMLHLSARLRHVRILNGDWSRLVTTSAAHTLPVRQGNGPAGVFLDPPYDNAERVSGLYGEDDGNVAADCRRWCQENGDNERFRIVLAGYDTEHADLEQHGWTVHEWFTDGFLTGGYGNIDGTSQQNRERLWTSPHCVTQTATQQLGIFDA